jgi:hypothetical protein
MISHDEVEQTARSHGDGELVEAVLDLRAAIVQDLPPTWGRARTNSSSARGRSAPNRSLNVLWSASTVPAVRPSRMAAPAHASIWRAISGVSRNVHGRRSSTSCRRQGASRSLTLPPRGPAAARTAPRRNGALSGRPATDGRSSGSSSSTRAPNPRSRVTGPVRRRGRQPTPGWTRASDAGCPEPTRSVPMQGFEVARLSSPASSGPADAPPPPTGGTATGARPESLEPARGRRQRGTQSDTPDAPGPQVPGSGPPTRRHTTPAPSGGVRGDGGSAERTAWVEARLGGTACPGLPPRERTPRDQAARVRLWARSQACGASMLSAE